MGGRQKASTLWATIGNVGNVLMLVQAFVYTALTVGHANGWWQLTACAAGRSVSGMRDDVVAK